ncbi:tetratricopeptide repeat protein [Corynebacterium sp.]|uniref:tetratricopeptide repeat protein n=1 Tax=Corynebacterium sp. TaxID=1720 RepID=UPI0026DC2894|nr:tetratricopeptide repeat protein [Corynebacterium sp.]MDO5031648.1 tetratricopeptide repeat protein [Corynebacterium sp.]
MSDTNSTGGGEHNRESSERRSKGGRPGGKKFEGRGGRREDNNDGRGNRAARRGSGKGRAERYDRGRGSKKNSRRKIAHPQRSGYREERINQRMADPDLPSDIDIEDLDPSVLQDLKSLSKENGEAVAKHMIMAATWMEDDPQLALRHARAAKSRAGRVSVAREVNGIAAYRAGEWKEALSELRAARRISGGPGLLAVMADCERGLGRPEKAIELGRSEEAKELAPEDVIELAIVVAGARLDLGQAESAVVTIQRANPNKEDTGMSACRLSYAYGNALLEAGRKDEAKEWFLHAQAIDEGEWTDAAERVAECE